MLKMHALLGVRNSHRTRTPRSLAQHGFDAPVGAVILHAFGVRMVQSKPPAPNLRRPSNKDACVRAVATLLTSRERDVEHASLHTHQRLIDRVCSTDIIVVDDGEDDIWSQRVRGVEKLLCSDAARMEEAL